MCMLTVVCSCTFFLSFLLSFFLTFFFGRAWEFASLDPDSSKSSWRRWLLSTFLVQKLPTRFFPRKRPPHFFQGKQPSQNMFRSTVRWDQNKNSKDFVWKYPIDFIFSLENKFYEWCLAGSDLQNTVKHHRGPDTNHVLFDVLGSVSRHVSCQASKRLWCVTGMLNHLTVCFLLLLLFFGGFFVCF